MKQAIALLMNDVHISKDNIHQFIANWGEAHRICKQKGIHSIFVGGDLWQSSSSQSLSVLTTVKQTLQGITSSGIDIVIAEGNHCKVDTNAVNGYSHIFDTIPGVIVIDKGESFQISEDDSVILTIMSYFKEDERFPEVFEEIEDHVKKRFAKSYNILYLHQGIQGGLATPTPKDLPASMFSFFDKVLVGHYHDRKCIPGTNIEYIGSSRQHNFGEDEEKGYTIVYSDGSTEFIKNEVNYRFVTISVTPSQVNDALLGRISELKKDPRYMVKLQINGKPSEIKAIDKQSLFDAGVTKVDMNSIESISEATHSGLETRFDKQGIRSEYQEFCSQKAIEDVELGLKYIDKIQ